VEPQILIGKELLMLSPRLFPALLVAVAAALGCAQTPKAPRLGPEDFPNATPPPSRAPSASVPSNPGVELVDLHSPEIRAAMKEFVQSGRAPLIRHRDRRFIRFPYGHSDPLLYCKPLRVCDLELQAGEQVLDVALGDTEMWHAQKMESGPAGLRSPHVIFKPVQDGVSTNAIVTTDRRVYHLGLIARVDETGDNSQSYVRHASFYYPNDTVTEWKSAEERRRDQALAAQAAQAAANEPVIPRDLHRGYEITGDMVPWRPEEVFDDGTRVYIKMPDAMHVTEAPALWVIDEFGEQILVNYRVREGHYIVDKLFGKARMAVGVGSRASEVYITREKSGESLGASEREAASGAMASAQ
jgi:type IV secretion system protein VirB9